MVAVHGLIDDHIFEGFAVFGDADKLVDITFEMLVVLVHDVQR